MDMLGVLRQIAHFQVYGQVKRFETITVEAYDLDGRGFAMDLDELPARVVQHETDHLDGVMFFDRMSETDRQGLEPQIDEFVTGSQRAAAGRALYIEAVVGRDNAASHAIARNALGEPAEEGTDDRSGEPATQYLRRFDL